MNLIRNIIPLKASIIISRDNRYKWHLIESDSFVSVVAHNIDLYKRAHLLSLYKKHSSVEDLVDYVNRKLYEEIVDKVLNE